LGQTDPSSSEKERPDPIAAGGELWVMMRRFKCNARFQQGASEQ